MDREVGENLAVQFDPGEREAVDKSGIGQTMLAHRRVDALDPQRAEVALVLTATDIGVLERLLEPFRRDAVGVLGAAAETLGGLQNLLVPGVLGNAAFDA